MKVFKFKKKIMNNMHERFVELDVIRGAAIGLMILLHFLWDLDYFGIYPLNNEIYQFQKIPQIMFFSIIGICLVISKNKKLSYFKTYNEFTRYNIRRGLTIFGIGIFISIVTYIFLPDTPVIFGVMHFIGLSIILSLFFFRFRYFNIIIALLFISMGFFLGQYHIENPSIFHLILGVYPKNIWSITIDYFPLIPWFGWVLVGMFLGEVLYKDNKRIFNLPKIDNESITLNLLSFFGQNSLLIYIVHQPIIAGLITIYLFF